MSLDGDSCLTYFQDFKLRDWRFMVADLVAFERVLQMSAGEASCLTRFSGFQALGFRALGFWALGFIWLYVVANLAAVDVLQMRAGEADCMTPESSEHASSSSFQTSSSALAAAACIKVKICRYHAYIRT